MKATLKEIQSWLVGSQLNGDAGFDGISTDSRTVKSGNLFVALKGEHFDAHEFLNEAKNKGIAAVVAEHVPDGFQLPSLIVGDSRLALGEMAKGWRKHFSIPVIGVTGSNGKTTVKEMIASILRESFGEYYLSTSQNLNNDIGVPQTVFRLDKTHKAAVIELGMNHPGEIAYLASIAQPMIGLVNNAQREHQEFMVNVEAVAKENGSVIRSLPSEGTAIFPAGDAFTGLWTQYALENKNCKVMTFGFVEDATVRGKQITGGGLNELEVSIDGKKLSVRLSVFGKHNHHNALAAAACCHAIGISSESIVRGLEVFLPVNGRLQYKKAANGALLIDDTYNANPDSVLAAIEALAAIDSPRVLVLGDMGEVGNEGPRFHEEVGLYAKKRGIEHFYALGELTCYSVNAYGSSARHFKEIDELNDALHQVLTPSSAVLVKGSRFMKMERVVNDLIERK